MNVILKFILSSLIFFVLNDLSAQSDIQKGIESLAADPIMNHATISMTVMDVKTGKIITSYQPDMSLSPASSLKVITTATALAILGKDFQFTTTLEYDGTIADDGTLYGNIYIKGQGDPTLGTLFPVGNTPLKPLMMKFIKAIKDKGIKRIEGKIIGDDSAYSTASTPESWQWNDIGNYYGAGTHALNINANSYELFFRQNPTIGQQPTLEKTIPQLYNITFINEVESAHKNSGDQCYIYGAPYQNIRFLRGTIPLGNGLFKVKGSLPDPAFYAAAILLENLESQGIKTKKIATSSFSLRQEKQFKKDNRQRLTVHYSPSLYEIAKVTNEKSINLYAEAMLMAIGKKQKGEASTKKGIEALIEFWEDKNINMNGFFMEDGSGLSVRNGMTSKHFASILRAIKIDPLIDFDFKKTLAISGKTGTLRYMFKNSMAEGRIFGKTGSMNRIRSYSGYILNQSNHLQSFSIIINNYDGSSSACRKLLESWILQTTKH